ncbi:NUDIX domain-containing protein [Pelagibacterium flavum]|uniref:GDP-mannose pyrophosphatase n=1 Tax=Pelagibacterium flavum TaxID=2984530 RepID=A0ABY6IP90_9HYPH|nr:NUDIX domain-containing protein [Pelagibacterium sp. YIM 151497]UYQ72433.1 NUDIX domain-containing protein [Pelagibacterium sp. YIM 151497]
MSEPTPILIKSKKILASAWGSLTEYVLGVKRADGRGLDLVREVYDHGSAAAILLLDPQRAVMTLVRQFRLPPHLNGDDGNMIEVCAGLLDGDDPETCVTKEALEETGIVPSSLHFAFEIYASPGSLSEKAHCFIGLYDETCRMGTGGGLAEEGEEIECVEIGFDAALDMIDNGHIIDAKTVALIQHAALKGFLG